ncbi:cobalamin-dependent protein [Candidatus Woesearchaeota archaeon]|nr:cobalamin-dependent protein [Candidatus Woesearchaeota archaeon]
MKIGLINVNFKSEGPEVLVGYMTPYPLLLIGGALIDKGFKDCKLIDAAKENLSIDQIVKEIISNKFDIVFLSAMASTASTPDMLLICNKIKSKKPLVITVIGGIHATYMYEHLMQENKDIDYICRGEGENFSVSLIKTLNNQGDLNQVRGLVWRKNNKIIVNNEQDIENNIDKFRVGWELIEDWSKYACPTTGEISAVVQFSRGCPFQCTFCGQWKFWKKWRHRSITNFVNELEFLNKSKNVTYFFFADENPQTKQELWISLFKEIIRRKLKIHMIMNIRVPDIIRDEPYLEIYKKAGVFAIDLGVESAIQQRLNKINKKTSIDQNAKAISLLRENNILSIVQTLIGFPDESNETLELTFNKLKEWNPDLLHFYYVTPLPWTDFGIEITQDMIVEKDLSKWDYRNQILKLNNMTSIVLRKKIKMFKFKYNYNSNNFFRIIKNKNPYLQKTMVNSLFLILQNRIKKHNKNE